MHHLCLWISCELQDCVHFTRGVLQVMQHAQLPFTNYQLPPPQIPPPPIQSNNGHRPRPLPSRDTRFHRSAGALVGAGCFARPPPAHLRFPARFRRAGPAMDLPDAEVQPAKPCHRARPARARPLRQAHHGLRHADHVGRHRNRARHPARHRPRCAGGTFLRRRAGDGVRARTRSGSRISS